MNPVPSLLKNANTFMYRNFVRTMAQYTAVERGSLYTFDYRIFFRGPNGYVSPWHDIPLYADKENEIFNMVCEVPRWTNAKMEISRVEKLNPIVQDKKKEKLRFVDSCFPHHGYIWNYGALPQTWENPQHKDTDTQANGDNDPIDVCEIGSRVAERGEVIQVKILGTLALIDEGETDWKLIGIDIRDPKAQKLNDIEDVEKEMPGLLRATHEWFKIYKIPTGKPANLFAFGGQYKNREYALKVVQDTNEFWKTLVNDQSTDMAIENVTVSDSIKQISPQDAEAIVAQMPLPGPPAPVDDSAHHWHFIKESDKSKM